MMTVTPLTAAGVMLATAAIVDVYVLLIDSVVLI
jgi:hypothetical protein